MLQESLSEYPHSLPPQSSLTRSPLRVTPYLLHRQTLELDDGSDRLDKESGLEWPPEEREDREEPTEDGGVTVPIL